MKHIDTVLRYRQRGTREWLTHEDGRVIPRDLSDKIMANIREQNGRFKDGEKFKVVTLGETSPLDNTRIVEFTRIEEPPIVCPPLTGNPQTLAEWRVYLTQLQAKNPHEPLGGLIEGISTAQVFEFGEVDEHRLDKERARAQELMDKGYLRMPYDCVVYRYTGNVNGRIHLAARWNHAVVMIGASGTKMEKTLNHYVGPLSLILATKGTKQRTEVPSTKLQAKRTEKGKSILPTVTYVDAEHYYAGVRNAEHRGTHASPVPHLRRGHLRTLANGHTTWIRDMLVNCRSADEAIVRRLYEVKHG